MRRIALSLAAVAVLSLSGVAARAGDPPAAAPPAPNAPAPESAEALVRRLLATHAEDRAKADAELAAADRDTLLAVARRLRDDFGTPLPRLAATTKAVEVELRWVTVAPDGIGPLFGVDPCATKPLVSSVTTNVLYAAIQKSASVQQITASKITCLDRQKASLSVLNRVAETRLVTGLVVGAEPHISADAKTITFSLSVESRRQAEGAPLAVVGSSWRSDLSIEDDTDATIVFPAAFEITGPDATGRRLALHLHAKIVDLGPDAIGTPIRDFDPTFDMGETPTPPSK